MSVAVDMLNLDSDAYQTDYPDLVARIRELKQFAEPLQEEVIVSPLLPLISRIMNLDDDLVDIEPREIERIEAEVKDCESKLEEMSYSALSAVISRTKESKVFAIVRNGNLFEKKLKKAIGKKIQLPNGTTLEMTAKIAKALTRYKFSIGTPPVTPEAIDSIEKLLVGGNLSNLYQYRELLSRNTNRRIKFDRFIAAVEKLIDQSTHYTTAAEKKEYEREATDFRNLEGLRGFGKTTVSGTPQSAIRLIKTHLLKKHTNGGTGEKPFKLVEGGKLDDNLIEKMQKDTTSIFIVRVKKVDPQVFSGDQLLPKWKGVIGRLIVIEDGPNASKTCTTVYSVHSLITETINKFHIKDSGTQANTQMNLRRILENFSKKDLHDMREEIAGKMAEMEEDNVVQLRPDNVRRREWHATRQQDYFNLKNFLQFIDFIQHIKDADEAGMKTLNDGLIAENERLTMDYFYSALKGKGYKCVAVPQGGGRRELGLLSKYHLESTQAKVVQFRKDKLDECRQRLTRLKAERGLTGVATEASDYALKRSREERDGPLQALRNGDPEIGSLASSVQNRLEHALHGAVKTGLKGSSRLRRGLATTTSTNVTGIARSLVSRALKESGVGAAAKELERGKVLALENRVRAAAGQVARQGERLLDTLDGSLNQVRRGYEESILQTAENMLNDIENNSFYPSLALSKVGWTFDDPFEKEEYPIENYIYIDIDKKGQINPASLEKHLLQKQEELINFPELFELYCSSIVLVFNDPHNPTSAVANNDRKLAILRIAAKYNLTLCSDEAYRKQTNKKKKDLQGDCSLAEVYENNKARFEGYPRLKIATSLPTTKWSAGAGKRTGTLMISEALSDFETFIRENTDSVNTMSLYMDNRELAGGLIVKEVCKSLEESFGPIAIGGVEQTIEELAGVNLSELSEENPLFGATKNLLGKAFEAKSPDEVIDTVVEKYFGELQSGDNHLPAVYFSLLEARNHLDFLKFRTENDQEYRIEAALYISSFISNLKTLRLDKVTQKDTVERTKAAIEAVKKVAEEYPFLSKSYIEPEGPFYMCVKLDDNDKEDSAFTPFLEAISLARHTQVVPQPGDYARFAFGATLDGTPEGYGMLSRAIETDLKILIEYWEKFKAERAALIAAREPNPERLALRKIFSGKGNDDLAKTLHEKLDFIQEQVSYQEKNKPKLVHEHSANVDDYISKIEPSSPAHIVKISRRDLRFLTPKTTLQEFVKCRAFQRLYTHYLLEVQSRIPELQHLSKAQLEAKYGPQKCQEKIETGRNFTDKQRQIFGRIMVEIGNIWFSQNTIKIAATSDKEDAMGKEQILSELLKKFIRVFAPKDMEDQITFQPTFQAGYKEINRLKGHEDLPPWLQKIIGRGNFAKEVSATDPSPRMTTGGKARVPGFERQIFRRDGDGENKPSREFFSKNFDRLSKMLNPRDYVMKMLQIGGTKVLVVIKNSYQHYLAEELRLFPQIEISDIDDPTNLRPDAVSFLGIPSKVIGEQYRIGYFFDKTQDGKNLPVSWVDEENITDYMGYLKKPILTVANEKVKEKGMLPIHGSAFTITFKNGLRKTIVMAGDSGTGKSETIIAMMEKIIKRDGGAQNVASIDLLSGDMLSLFVAEDNKLVGGETQIYMVGTEKGDYMRTTDISEGWQERFRDLIESGSHTNAKDPTNPRITVDGICDENKFLIPVRVNGFFNINNFDTPPGGQALVKTEDARNLLMHEYVRGYRGEKGTSGDQPNIYASLKASIKENPDPQFSEPLQEVLDEFNEGFDSDILGWNNIVIDENGKAANATLCFKDRPGEVFSAKKAVQKIFVGKTLKYPVAWDKKGKPTDYLDAEIKDTKFDPQTSQYKVILKFSNGTQKTVPLDRKNVFSKIFQPIASTFDGDPFVDPEGMDELMEYFARVMNQTEIITGTIYTQLKREGMEFDGPSIAADALINMLLEEDVVATRFKRQEAEVSKRIIGDYGDIVLREGSIPIPIMKENLRLNEQYESATLKPKDRNGNVIELSTTKYKYDPNAKPLPFKPRLLTTENEQAIRSIRADREYRLINMEGLEFKISDYDDIKCWENIEELMFQILLKDGNFELSYTFEEVIRNRSSLKRAEVIAQAIIQSKRESVRAAAA